MSPTSNSKDDTCRVNHRNLNLFTTVGRYVVINLVSATSSRQERLFHRIH